CNAGIDPQIDELQDIPYDTIPSWKKILEKEGRIYSENINALPSDLVEILAQQEIISLIVYPLVIEHKLQGFIGFDECRQNRRWSDIELEILKTTSGIISSSMERNFLQEKLIQSETNFRNFFDTIDDFFIIGSMSGDVLCANSAVSHKLGYTSEELKGKKIIELHPPDRRDQAGEILAAMFRGESGYCPLELQDKDGKRLPVETRVWIGKWNGEECIFGISKDLTKEQEALQKFTKLFESNPALMAISNVSDRRITDVNIAFLTKLGYKKNEVIGKSTSELEIFADPEKQSEIRSELLATGRVRDIELLVKAKDGTLISGLFSGEIIDNFGEKSFLTVMVDISEQVKLRQEVEEQRKRLENIIEGTNLGTWEWNVKTGETVFNERWAEIVGYTLPELEPVSIDTWINFAHPDDLQRSNELIQKHFAGELEYYEFESRMKHKNGDWVWVLDRGKVVERDEAAAPVRMFGTHADITKQKQAEMELKESHDVLERFFSVNLDLLCIADTEGNFIKTNRAWEDILGYSTAELENRKFLEFIHPDDLDSTYKSMAKLEEQVQVIDFINRYRSKDGTYRFIEWRSHPYGKLIYAAARDITDRIEYEEKIKELSIRDPLTNIYNRRHVFERLEGVISEASRNGKIFSVSILDIDFFKKINDEYGHLAGDFILKEFADIISKNLRPYDLFGRYGGEEFIIVSSNSAREQSCRTIERILDLVRNKVFVYNDIEIKFTFSAGISDSLEFEKSRLTSEIIIETADNRLYMAKESGRNRIVISDIAVADEYR
ncbi:MAG TPA: PAS domain S-box protein, partial [Spirochaetota bacterium]|nr:PAS domain S-box protein [Spirochaetota bacterium]